MPEKIIARFRIITPMFIGDANQQATCISPAAVKGALRFWWRALNWGKVRPTCESDQQALRQLHQIEAGLFGSAAEQGTGQASFKVSVSASNLSTTTAGATHKHFKTHDASRYLGYGLMEVFASRKKGTEAGQLVRDCFNEDQGFTVSLLSRSALDQTVLDALIAFGLLGALGSRSRHGLGSVALEKIHRGDELIWNAPDSQLAYRQAILALINTSASAVPPFSAFSTHSRIDSLFAAKTPYQALDGFALRELIYRSWGNGGKVLGQDSEKRFKPDHDWKHGDRPNNFHPRRVVFGLPHNYGQGNHLAVSAQHYDRRSSPLIFHVHKIGSEYLGVSILLESDFLPKGEHINAGGKMAPANIEWSILHDFLDGQDKQGKLRFADRERVL